MKPVACLGLGSGYWSVDGQTSRIEPPGFTYGVGRRIDTRYSRYLCLLIQPRELRILRVN
jgi:hypothetical protein